MPTRTLAALLFAAASLSAQQTLTVAAAGGAMFTDIGAAVAAANSGDVLLVAGGTYAPFTVNGKGLSILASSAMVFASGSGPTPVPPSITIENLTPSQHVHLVGFSVMGFQPAPALVLVRNNQGSVWMHDMFVDAFGSPGVGVDNSVDVVIENILVQANRGLVLANGTSVPMPGMRLSGSAVRICDAEIRASAGAMGGGSFPTISAGVDGGDGIEVIGSSVTIEGAQVRGGSGVTFFSPACNQGGSGGDAIVMSNNGANASTVRLRNVALQPGTASTNTCPGTVSNGMQLNVLGGTPILDAGVERLLRGPAGIFGPTVLPVEVVGLPGDVAFVFAGLPGASVHLGGLPLHLYPPVITLGFVTLGPTGRGTLNVPVMGLGPMSPPIVLALQALVLDTGLAAFATNPRPLIAR